MNTTPRLVLGIGAALALGSLSAMATRGLASAAPAPSQPAAVNAPVLAPTSIGGVATGSPQDDPLALPDGIGTMGVVPIDAQQGFDAHATGAAPASAPPSAGLPADVQAAFEDFAASDGPGPSPAAGLPAQATTPLPSLTPAPSAAPGTAGTPDDPCATEGADPSSCPGGLQGAIYADTAHEDLQLWPLADAPTTPDNRRVYCDGAAPGDNQLWLDVATNLPAAIHARYWPTGDPSAASDLTLTDVPSERAAWQDEVDRTGTYTRGAYIFQHCSLLSDLRPNTEYTMTAYGTDIYDRVSAPIETTFNSAGAPTFPAMYAQPFGDHLLFVGVPHKPGGNAPELWTAFVEPGQDPPSCATHEGPSRAATVGDPIDAHVSASYRRDHHQDESYTRQLDALLDLPEGATVLICANWYSESGASFDRGVPTQTESLVVNVPDTVSPVFTLASIDVVKGVRPNSLSVETSSLSGIRCGGWFGPDTAVGMGPAHSVEALLCDRAHASRGTVRPVGAGEALVVTASWERDDTVGTVSTRGVIRLPHIDCPGGTCDLPPSRTYSIALPQVDVPTGMCGSGFGGDCTPPTRETALGTATIRVDWDRGHSNGATTWEIGDATTAHPDAPVAPTIQFDGTRTVEPTLAADGLSATADVTIRADRAATYSATLAGDCWTDGPISTQTGSLTASGRYFTAPIHLAGLCPGSRYRLTVDLAGDDGTHVMVSPVSGDGSTMWLGGGFTTPEAHVHVTGTITVLADTGWSRAWWLGGADLTTTASGYPGPTAVPDQRCRTAADQSVPMNWDSRTLPLRATMSLELDARVTAEASYSGVNHDADCSWPSVLNFEVREPITVTAADLARGVRVEGDFLQRAIDPTVQHPKLHYVAVFRSVREDGGA